LEEASKDEVYRIKGILYATSAPRASTENKPKESAGGLAVGAPSRYILNWAFGRWTFTPAPFDSTTTAPLASGTATPLSSGYATPLIAVDEPTLRMTIITAKYESSRWQKRIEAGEFTALDSGSVGALSVKRVS